MRTTIQDIDKGIEKVLAQIKSILDENKKYPWIVIIMSAIIFIIGVTLIVIGIYNNFEWKILTPSAILTGFLYWPIKRLLGLWKDSVLLPAIPLIINGWPTNVAEKILSKFLDNFGK